RPGREGRGDRGHPARQRDRDTVTGRQPHGAVRAPGGAGEDQAEAGHRRRAPQHAALRGTGRRRSGGAPAGRARRGRPLIYMDTSALVTWITRRSHWGALDVFLQERATEPLATSTLGFVETVRTLDLMGHFPKAMEDLDARITEILLTREVRDAAALLVGRLRTLDAIHVASALSLRDDLTALVTYDRRMLETARAE